MLILGLWETKPPYTYNIKSSPSMDEFRSRPLLTTDIFGSPLLLLLQQQSIPFTPEAVPKERNTFATHSEKRFDCEFSVGI